MVVLHGCHKETTSSMAASMHLHCVHLKATVLRCAYPYSKVGAVPSRARPLPCPSHSHISFSTTAKCLLVNCKKIRCSHTRLAAIYCKPSTIEYICNGCNAALPSIMTCTPALSLFISHFLCVTNMGTWVPSLLVTNTCSMHTARQHQHPPYM